MRPVASSALLLALCSALVISVGCKSDAPDAKPGVGKAEGPNSARPREPSSAALDLSQITVPTEEDFEEKAEREITPDNLEAELDRLEKEIDE